MYSKNLKIYVAHSFNDNGQTFPEMDKPWFTHVDLSKDDNNVHLNEATMVNHIGKDVLEDDNIASIGFA